MKKLLILLFSLLISFNSYGVMKLANGIIWHLVSGNSNGNEFYLDMQSIKQKDGLVYYWILVNYDKPMDGFSSAKIFKEGDCSLKRDKTLTMMSYKEPMGEGSDFKTETPRNPEWIYNRPSSGGLFLMEDACIAAGIEITTIDGIEFETTEIKDDVKLKEIEREKKYFGTAGVNWRDNKNYPRYHQNDSIKFNPSELEFIFDKPINGIKITGILIPQYVGDLLSHHWGKALVTFTRLKDNKSFNLYVNKLVFSKSNNVCEDYQKADFNFTNCKLTSKVPMIIENTLFDEPTFSFKDIDYDGIEELLFNVKFASRSGSETFAYNINENFEIDKINNISIVYTPNTSEFEFKNKTIIDVMHSSCCNWTEYTWKAIDGTYTLISVKEFNQFVNVKK